MAGSLLCLRCSCGYAAHPATFPSIITPTAALDVGTGSTSCTTSGSTRTCSTTLPALIGTDDFQITAWDKAPSSGSFSGGNELSNVTVTSTSVKRGVANQLNATLDGIVHSIALSISPSSLNAEATGSSAETATLTANAYDADGNVIIGSYFNASDTAVTLTIAQVVTESGDTLRTSLSGTTLSSSTSSLTVSCSGGGTWGTTFSATPSQSIGGTNTGASLKVKPTFTEYAVPTIGSGPEGIASGSDGNLWFTETKNNVAKITTSGAITEYPIPTASTDPNYITSGPDGNLWFGQILTAKIGKVTTSGSFSEYSTPTASISGIVQGADGNLWFGEPGNWIGKTTTSGSMTQYTLPTSSGYVQQIAAGPDSNLWFTESAGNKIGRLIY